MPKQNIHTNDFGLEIKCHLETSYGFEFCNSSNESPPYAANFCNITINILSHQTIIYVRNKSATPFSYIKYNSSSELIAQLIQHLKSITEESTIKSFIESMVNKEDYEAAGKIKKLYQLILN